MYHAGLRASEVGMLELRDGVTQADGNPNKSKTPIFPNPSNNPLEGHYDITEF